MPIKLEIPIKATNARRASGAMVILQRVVVNNINDWRNNVSDVDGNTIQ